MSFQDLSRELVDYVIDFLHDDLSSLVSCSFVHSAWLHPSQFHLLSDISIFASHPPRPAPVRIESLLSEFLLLLRTSPHAMERAVRRLSITSAGRVPSNLRPQLIELQTVINVLELLPSTCFLTLAVVTLQACSTIRFRTPFSLKVLNLHNFISFILPGTETSVVSPFIRCFHSIDHLSIDVGSSSCNEGVPERPTGKVRVTDLSLIRVSEGEGIGVCQLPLHTVDLSSVDLLDCPLPIEDAKSMNVMRCIIMNCTSLKVLRIDLECFITPGPFQRSLLALDSLPFLQKIELPCIVFVADQQDMPFGLLCYRYLQWKHGADFIASLSGLQRLKSFTVRVRIGDVDSDQPLTNIASALRDPTLWADVFPSLLLLPACVEKLVIQFLVRPSLLLSAKRDPTIVDGVKAFIKSALQASRIPLVIEFIYQEVIDHINLAPMAVFKYCTTNHKKV